MNARQAFISSMRPVLLIALLGSLAACHKKGASASSSPHAASADGGSAALVRADGGVLAAAPAKGKDGGAADEPTEKEGERLVEGKVGKSDTLSSVLTREGIERDEQAEIIKAMTGVFDFKTVRAGQTYSIRFDAEGDFTELDYISSPIVTYKVTRQGDALEARREEKPVTTEIVEIGGSIDSTLYDSIKKTGESTALVGTIVNVFSWDLNFYTDQHPGDRFKVVIEKQSLDGKPMKYGKLLAAEYAGKVGTFRAFYFQPKGAAKGSYFDDKGQNIVKSMLKTPLRYVRISSNFNPHRMHPILHIVRGHMGTDFAAPVGTPVWATADGKVVRRMVVAESHGQGNVIELSHSGGLSSIYMHLSKFAKGLKVGQVVHQKQVIGYVGATGLATGPHLHFSLKMNGSYVDPQKMKLRRDAPVPKGAMEAFRGVLGERMAAFKRIETRTAVAAAPAAVPPAVPPGQGAIAPASAPPAGGSGTR